MASPARQPARKPQPPARKPVRRPPDRRKPPADRPRRRKDTRPKPPSRPSRTPNPRVPSKPLFPVVPKRPTQFGRRFPVSMPKPPGFPRSIWRKLLPPGIGMLIPIIAAKWPDQMPDMAAYGWTLCCGDPSLANARGPLTTFSISNAQQPPSGNPEASLCVTSSQNLCGTFGQVPAADWPSPIGAVVPTATSGDCVLGQVLRVGIYNQSQTRYTITASYSRIIARRSNCSGGAGVPYEWPEMLPIPGGIPSLPEIPGLPQWVDPLPDPLAPEPMPVPKPVKWPDPSPSPEEGPRPNPQPDPPIKVPPTGLGPGQPSIDVPLAPGSPPVPRPGWHVKEPPGPGDKEKKKRLSPAASRAWLETLVNSFTETDDMVAAIYRALPWQVRRWKGRDGVWRERDITTKDRLERIYSEIGNLSVKKAVDNLIKDYLTDMAFGKVGNAMKKKIRELADEGLFVGSQGLGGQRYNRTWEEAEKELQKRAASEKNKHARIIRTRHYNKETGQWETREQYEPMTEIPWFRQKSNYPREAVPGEAEYWELTKAEREANARTVDRYYYADRPSRNDVYKGNAFPGYKSYKRFYGNR